MKNTQNINIFIIEKTQVSFIIFYMKKEQYLHSVGVEHINEISKDFDHVLVNFELIICNHDIP